MGGLVKGVKKAFKAVGGFVKKYWKVIAIAAAVYFTAGIALAAFPSTAGFAAAMPGFGAGGIFSGAATAMGIGSAESVAGGAGLFGNVATMGAAGAVGSLEAVGAGAELMGPPAALAGGVAAPVAAGTAETVGAGAALMGPPAEGAAASALTSVASPAAAAATTAATTGSGLSTVAETAGKGFWGGMSAGEKMMLASTAFQGLSGLLKPGPTLHEQGLWPADTFGGVDKKGAGIDLGAVYKNAMTGSDDPTALSAYAATTGSDQGAPVPVEQAKSGGQAAPTQSGQVAGLAAGGDSGAAPGPAAGPAAPPSAAASAQTGSPFLSAGGAATTAQQATAQQAGSFEATNKANQDFIAQTYANLDPTKRGAA